MECIIYDDYGNKCTPLITNNKIKIVVEKMDDKEETTLLMSSNDLRMIADWIEKYDLI